jgi:integrase
MLTDLGIKKLPIPESRREVPDGKIAGLYLVIQPSGAKSWAVRYRAFGVPRKLTLGAYPAVDLARARRRAQEALGDVKDPGAAKKAVREAAKAERKADSDKVERIAELFIERYVKRSGRVGAGWGKEIERLFKIEILPRIGDMRIGDVKKLGPIGKLLLLTGARRSEIAEASWREIDLAAKTLTLPGSRTKNDKPHVIPLSDAAVDTIQALPRIEGKSGLVFSTTGATSVSGFSRSRETIDRFILDALRREAAARGDDPEAVVAPAPRTLHDLRRTVATNLQKLGVRLEVTEARC